MLNSAFSSIAQHPLTFSQPIHAESSPMPPRSTSSGGNRSPERGPLEGNRSVKQWSISTYLPSHIELIHLWISGMFILHNVESSGYFSRYLLEFYHVSYCSSSLLELFLAWFVWFQSSCFSTTSQAAPSHPLSSLLSFTDHLALCTPQYLFLVLCSLVSLCNLFWGGSPSHWGPGYHRCVDNFWISESGLSINLLPTSLPDILQISQAQLVWPELLLPETCVSIA